jgi:hypothetical protein
MRSSFGMGELDSNKIHFPTGDFLNKLNVQSNASLKMNSSTFSLKSLVLFNNHSSRPRGSGPIVCEAYCYGPGWPKLGKSRLGYLERDGR